MSRRRWLTAAGALFALLGAAYAVAHLRSESMLRVARVELPPAPAHGDPVQGERLSRVMGCQDCHGPQLQGQVFMAQDFVYRLVAPDLGERLTHYSDEALVRLLRTGAKPDGRLGVGMPYKSFQRLNDAEVGHLLAYLRSRPQTTGSTLPDTWFSPLARVALALGAFPMDRLAADPVDDPGMLADRAQPDTGRRLAQAACGECHGVDFAGDPDDGIPPLAIVHAYNPEAFTALLRSGRTLAGTDSASGEMSQASRHRLSALNDAEIAAIHRALTRPASQGR